ncbi:MAG: DUF6356 family protein [Hyphomicrobiales bacterium]
MALKGVGLFTDHPASVDETYGEHFVFATSTGLKLLGAGAAAVIHGVLPFMFETTASDMMKKLHSDLSSRRKVAEGKVSELSSSVEA